MACATALLLRPTIARSARSPVLALTSSIIYVGFVLVVAAAAGEMQLRCFRKLLLGSQRILLLTLLCGTPWLAPVIVLCPSGGMQAIIAIGALAFFNGTLLGQFENLLHPVANQADKIRSSEILPGFSATAGADAQQFNVTVAICVAYVGVLIIACKGEHAIAAALIALSCFLVGWIKQRCTSFEKQPLATVVLRFSQHAIWASFVTFLALLPHAGQFSLAQLASHLRTMQGENPSFGKLQSGVILLAKRKPPILLELARRNKFESQAVRRSFSIPFSGEYWFFPKPRSPLSGDDWFFQETRKRPPASSLKEEGDPTTLNMTLEDSGAMVMQAQQRIGSSVDIHCCRWIDVVLNGEDEQPRYVDIELLVVDSSATGQDMQTLGAQLLANPVNVTTSAHLKTLTFRFSIPSKPEIHSFNELFVWFHLKAPRMQRSATVRIDRFDLIP
jgi:hypothetical protein